MNQTQLSGVLVGVVLAIAGPGCGKGKQAQPSEIKTPPRHGPGAHWGYSGKTGPGHWGELQPAYAACKTGKKQSPVDITSPTGAKSGQLSFRYKGMPLHLINNGHTIQIDLPLGGELRVGAATFELKQIHFHAPSEHTVGGKAFALEAHFVHAAEDDELAVVAVLFEDGAADSTLQAILPRMPREVGRSLSLKGLTFDGTRLLPARRTAYRYRGSLTTPPCTEGVQWIVLRDPRTISASQLATFRKIYQGNARPVQPLNGRVVTTDR